jgi:hypothetical protein
MPALDEFLSGRHALVIDRDGTDLRRGGADFETFLAIEQCRYLGKEPGA